MKYSLFFFLCMFAGEILSNQELTQIFGGSKELVKSASLALQDKTYPPNPNISKSLEEAHRVASCGYESGTGWGKQVCHTNYYSSPIY